MTVAVLGGLWLASAAFAGPETLNGVKTYERYVGIDGACAWPQLTRLPGGELAVLIWPRNNHGLTEGAAECWVSADRGTTWRRAGVPVPNAPTTNRMNLAGGLTADGTYVAAVSGWNKRPPFREDARLAGLNHTGATTLPAVVACSRDGGHTWTDQHDLGLPAGANGSHPIPFGRIAPVSASGSEIGLMVYLERVEFCTSADGGKTWQVKGLVSGNRVHNETTWLRLANGDLFAAARTAADTVLEGFRSIDGGATWKSEGRLTMPYQAPADLIALPDGRVLLSHGVRNSGFYGIAVRIADATARNWGPQIFLVDLEGSTDLSDATPSRDGGYPSSVALPDGLIITAYYSKGVPAHRRYHMGVVRWSLPAK